MSQHFTPMQLETVTVQLQRGVMAKIPLSFAALLGTSINR